MTEIKIGVSMGVKRRPESWNYIYVMLGFALAIEGTIIGMITPLLFPWNVIAFAVIGFVTFRLFINNGWFQNKLISMKIKYENKER